MAKQIKYSEEKILRMHAEGRGKGKGQSYVPWIQVADFSSRGNSRRVFSHKTGRVHHLFSDVEWQLFLLLEYAPDVVDIREQFPLDRDDTLSIAAKLSIKHPTYPGTNVPAVMTCDFLATRQRNNAPTLEAYNCKREDEAEDVRSIEKLEIQRSYFNESDIPHHLVFHSMLPKNKIKNLEWIRSALPRQDEIEPYQDFFMEHCQRITSELAHHIRSCSLADFCESYDVRSGAEQGTGLRAVRMLLSQRKLITDLNEPNLAAAPVTLFRPAGKQALHSVGGL